MTNKPESRYPTHYTITVRALLRYALVMIVIGLLVGITFQESVKKLNLSPDHAGLGRLDATLHLALVHGHAMVIGVLIPVALAGMLHLARSHGGAEIGCRPLAVVVYTYLIFASVAIALMLYKGYHFLLAARAGKSNLEEIDAALFGGIAGLRHGIYGLSHVGMSTGLLVFVWCLWRSLRKARAN